MYGHNYNMVWCTALAMQCNGPQKQVPRGLEYDPSVTSLHGQVLWKTNEYSILRPYYIIKRMSKKI